MSASGKPVKLREICSEHKKEIPITTAVFLASDESSAITGQTLVVSCGMHISHY